MKTIAIVAPLLVLPLLSVAAPDPVELRLPEAKAWTGQKLSFSIDLFSPGSFEGPTWFTLPEVTDTVILRAGRATVSSKEIEGQTWFVQTHSFVLFSQANGTVNIPAFPVRFGVREGFTGPSTPVEKEVPAFEVLIERPPGTESAGFLVTTPSLEVTETWEPAPAKTVEVGAVFKRTVTQKAADLSGMALEPAPAVAPNGVRVYPGKAEVTDNTQRGAFDGKRVETLTYLIEQPGEHVLPELRYTWWDPEAKMPGSKTLPAITVTATAPPLPPSPWRFAWWGALVLLIGLSFLFRRSIIDSLKHLHTRIDPPPRRARRHFLRACRHDDAAEAVRTWAAWDAFHPGFRPSSDLRDQLLELHRHLYGPSCIGQTWQGRPLCLAFRLQIDQNRETPSLAALPPLNP